MLFLRLKRIKSSIFILKHTKLFFKLRVNISAIINSSNIGNDEFKVVALLSSSMVIAPGGYFTKFLVVMFSMRIVF